MITFAPVSVIIPLYNKENEVERAIKSVLAQTVQDFELIVINDGSTDKGPDKVRANQDRRIKIIDQSNSGVSAARNRGIEAASGDFIAFLDADDEWEIDHLETIFSLRAKYPSCSAFATRYYVCGPDFRRGAIIRGLEAGYEDGILMNYFNIAAQSDPPLWSSAVAVTKRSILAIKAFPTGITSGEDLLTWARLAARYNIAYSSKLTANFWEPRAPWDRPGRRPQMPDIVGQELLRLKKQGNPDRVKSLDEYLSLWHRMRASIYMQLGENINARRELIKAMKYSNNMTALLFFFVLSLLPARYGLSIYERVKRLYQKANKAGENATE